MRAGLSRAGHAPQTGTDPRRPRGVRLLVKPSGQGGNTLIPPRSISLVPSRPSGPQARSRQAPRAHPRTTTPGSPRGAPQAPRPAPFPGTSSPSTPRAHPNLHFRERRRVPGSAEAAAAAGERRTGPPGAGGGGSGAGRVSGRSAPMLNMWKVRELVDKA